MLFFSDVDVQIANIIIIVYVFIDVDALGGYFPAQKRGSHYNHKSKLASRNSPGYPGYPGYLRKQ